MTWPRLRSAIFLLACALIAGGVLLHLPMLAMAHRMGNRVHGMPMDGWMWAGMAFILIGIPLAFYGALPPRPLASVPSHSSLFEAPDETPLNRWHLGLLLVLSFGLVIDVMKPATLGFVLPGLAAEYGITAASAAWLPLVALTGTAIGSILWGWSADRYGRRVSIVLATILFVSTSICGAMPWFELNLLMCFLMGASAGGMLPVVYALLAELMPPRHRSWVLVLVGGFGMVGGYLAASFAAYLLEPGFGWRSLWLQGFPTGLLLLACARLIPESPAFLAAAGRSEELRVLKCRFGIVEKGPVPPTSGTRSPRRHRGLTPALVIAALAWSFVNFGLLLWLPSDLQARGYSAGLASGILASSALLALPTVLLAAFLYARASSKWTLVGFILLTLSGMAGALAPTAWLADPYFVVALIAVLIVGSNGMIAVLLPYAAENYPVGHRGRGTGQVAGASKFGGGAVQLCRNPVRQGP